ncbi:MAG: hypothetical protein VYB35_04590 [Verrucomicrobiota bacterium]|nr:hypothetical protein [Verrucomicrobiota bacterium]|tara:strand:- start:682 stop:942 length:261 start_codon:yes stop_codon:yes gene_type:complete
MFTLFAQVSAEQAGGGIGVLLFQIIILVSSIWVGIDSSKIELKKYKSGISYGPVVMVILCLLLWIVAFPWYLVVRGKINAGTAELK